MKKNLFAIASILLVALLVFGCSNPATSKVNSGTERVITFDDGSKALTDAAGLVKHLYLRVFEVDENGAYHPLVNESLNAVTSEGGLLTEAVRNPVTNQFSTVVKLDPVNNSVRFVAWAVGWNDTNQQTIVTAYNAYMVGKTPTALTPAEALAAKNAAVTALGAATVVGPPLVPATGLWLALETANATLGVSAVPGPATGLYLLRDNAVAALGVPAAPLAVPPVVATGLYLAYDNAVAAADALEAPILAVNAAAGQAYLDYLTIRDAAGDVTASLALWNMYYAALSVGDKAAIDLAIAAYQAARYTAEPAALLALNNGIAAVATTNANLTAGIAAAAAALAAKDAGIVAVTNATLTENIALFTAVKNTAVTNGEASGWVVTKSTQRDAYYDLLSTMNLTLVDGLFAAGKTGPAGGVIVGAPTLVAHALAGPTHPVGVAVGTTGVTPLAVFAAWNETQQFEMAPRDYTAPVIFTDVATALANDDINGYTNWIAPTRVQLTAMLGLASDAALFDSGVKYWTGETVVANGLLGYTQKRTYPAAAVTEETILKTLTNKVRGIRSFGLAGGAATL